MLKTIKAGIDIGSSYSKYAIAGGEAQSMRAVLGDFQPIDFTIGVQQFTDGIAIQYEKRQVFVGDLALKYSTRVISTVSQERIVSDEGTLLFVAAAAKMLGKGYHLLKVVVGLPGLAFERQALRDEYVSKIKKQHVVTVLKLTGESDYQCIIDVREVKVIPQHYGTVVHSVINNGAIDETAAGIDKGIIDIGYNTLGLARTEGMEYVKTRSKSFSELGVFTIYKALADEIFRAHGIEIPVEKIEPIAKSGQAIIRQKPISIQPLWERACQIAADQIIAKIKSYWPDVWSLGMIVITGGGGVILGKYLKKAFEEASISADPTNSNALGMAEFANQIFED